jgi:predicted NBD/HSP70 family sugar kinase
MTRVTSDLGRPWPPPRLNKAALRVADALKVDGPNTRARIGEITGMSRPTVSSAVAELSDRDLIENDSENGGPEQPIGRPAEVIRLSRRAGLVVGVDVGRRHIQVVLADLGHQEVDKMPTASEKDDYVHPPDADTDPGRALDKAAELVRSLIERNNSDLGEVIGVGLGIPAPITRDGVIGSSTLLPSWANFEAGSAFATRLDAVPVFVDNDASLGALGEYVFGAGRERRGVIGSHEMTYVKVATGIGAGMVRDGHVHRGAGGTAGEIGHITLDYKNETLCPCGNHGCLELYAGGEALLQKARTRRPDLTGLADLVNRAKTGDPFCESVIKDAGDYLGIALGTLVNLNSPDNIVIGGELSDAEEILLRRIRDKISGAAMPPAANAVTISAASLKSWSSAWGAAALVLKTTPPADA